MSQRIGGRADGGLSLQERVAGESLSRTAAEPEALTFIFSPSQRERREETAMLFL